MKMVESKFYRYECSICGKVICRVSKQDDQFECPDCKYEKHYLFSILNIRKFIKETQDKFERIEIELAQIEKSIDVINKRLDGLEADVIKYIQDTKKEIIKEIGITL